MRRRLADERAIALFRALTVVSKARTLEHAKKVAEGAMYVDGMYWRADEAVQEEEKPPK